MQEQLLVTEALLEREFLLKSINEKIHNLKLVDYRSSCQDILEESQCSKEAFERKAIVDYQSLVECIQRYRKLDAAIITSDGVTKIHTSCGDYTVHTAVCILKKLKGAIDDSWNTGYLYEDDDTNLDIAYFELSLADIAKNQYKDAVRKVNVSNLRLDRILETMHHTFHHMGDGKISHEAFLEMTDAYRKENQSVLVDPLDSEAKASAIIRKYESQYIELRAQIKMSNATTYISF